MWEKTAPFKIDGIEMAGQSGDVILYSQDARQIVVYDKDGNERFHWGPRIDRQPMGIDISDDGSVIICQTCRTGEYITAKRISTVEYGWDCRVHYSTKNGKELWNKEMAGASYLSPDGKMVAIIPSGGDGANITMLDSTGKVMWVHEVREVEGFLFSPDSNYVVAVHDKEYR